MNNKIIVRTYKKLEYYIRMFRNQTCDLLIIMSKGGYGKTSTLRKVMKNADYTYINTHSTPLKTHILLHEKKDLPVCFDDMDSILSNSIFVPMLKALTDTKPIKELHYHTTSKLLGEAPETFTTASNTCILLNEFDIRNKTLAPILDRAFYIEFVPTKEEILKKIYSIMQSQSLMDNEKCVYEFLKKNYGKIEHFSIRTYMKGRQLYQHDPKGWREEFMRMVGFDDKMVTYLSLKEKFSKDTDRLKHWTKEWSRATYYRIKQEMEE